MFGLKLDIQIQETYPYLQHLCKKSLIFECHDDATLTNQEIDSLQSFLVGFRLKVFLSKTAKKLEVLSISKSNLDKLGSYLKDYCIIKSKFYEKQQIPEFDNDVDDCNFSFSSIGEEFEMEQVETEFSEQKQKQIEETGYNLIEKELLYLDESMNFYL